MTVFDIFFHFDIFSDKQRHFSGLVCGHCIQNNMSNVIIIAFLSFENISLIHKIKMAAHPINRNSSWALLFQIISMHLICWNLISFNKFDNLIAQIACQWMERKLNLLCIYGQDKAYRFPLDFFKVLVTVFFPFLLFTPFLNVDAMGEKKVRTFQKILTFYTAPITKFTHYSVIQTLESC